MARNRSLKPGTRIRRAYEEGEALKRPDKIVLKRDGRVELRWTFFYRGSTTAEAKLAQAQQDMEAMGIQAENWEHGESWNAYPRDSFFWVRFRPTTPPPAETPEEVPAAERKGRRKKVAEEAAAV